MFRMYHLFAAQEKALINSFQLRNFKNFGHKKQPVPLFTFLWHGFLTFTLIGAGIEWKWIKKLIYDGDEEKNAASLE